MIRIKQEEEEIPQLVEVFEIPRNWHHITKFHQCHGTNIILKENNTVAFRKASFANAITFSDRPLAINEMFLIQIDEIEGGWSGHMRLGLTQLDPEVYTNETLPQYALPDLQRLSLSWVYPITKYFETEVRDIAVPSVTKSNDDIIPALPGGHNILGNSKFIKTSKGVISRSMLLSPNTELYNGIITTEVGTRIGIMYVKAENKEDYAHIHFFINGVDQGPMPIAIPYKDCPLHVVCDIYGTTKQVKIVQLYDCLTLQNACRDAIILRVPRELIQLLPLPVILKNYIMDYFKR